MLATGALVQIIMHEFLQTSSTWQITGHSEVLSHKFIPSKRLTSAAGFFIKLNTATSCGQADPGAHTKPGNASDQRLFKLFESVCKRHATLSLKCELQQFAY
mmetsp:Transcript_23547/g.45747  ORF Transcript_23547/g.45747 Transcript_23547/m.45747 type:complete len:102 (-) Transcript_23547:232-537(-)